MTSTTNSKWSPLWSMQDNICLSIMGDKGSRACGFNSNCSLKNDKKSNCECPERYLLDPNNKYDSRIPNFTLSCAQVEPNSTAEVYDLIVHDDVNWSLLDYEQINPSNETFFRQSCLQDCLCAVAIFRSNSCWKKKLPLSNGRLFVCKLATNWNLEQLVWLLPLIWKKKIMFHPNTNAAVETNLHCLAYQELAEAKNGFKKELGKGSCGVVYKGELQKSCRKIIVAVKKLDRMLEMPRRNFVLK
ncbi:hypothetical protein ACH5RR_009347 [Cinchona calisaya]|uniref:Uncharacterized protein n=1 Tax=Cinchona calisaya TaxID=153742 RepID=A0ABD3AHG7_9GENT